MPSGVDALLQMGLGDMLASVPNRRVESWEIWIDGHLAFAIPEPLQKLGERAMRVVSQPALLTRLVEEARRSPAFRFEPGSRVRDLIRKDGRVAGVTLETASGGRDLAADLVIGCDGRGSAVRAAADLSLELSPEQYDVLWCKAPAVVQGARRRTDS